MCEIDIRKSMQTNYICEYSGSHYNEEKNETKFKHSFCALNKL